MDKTRPVAQTRWVSGPIYIGLIVIDPAVEAKIREKHNVTGEEVREALQWPANAKTVEEDHDVHGRRWVALGTTAGGREVIGWMLPAPHYMGASADTWALMSARPLDGTKSG